MAKKQRKRKRSRACAATAELEFPPGWGGARAGAGRKRQASSGVRHELRPDLGRSHPVHITWRCVAGIPNLRSARMMAVLRSSFEAGRERFGFRLVHFSVQTNHMHLIAEAADPRSLQRGLQGLGVRIAKAINRLLGRSGRVLSDRYHLRELRTPSEVRSALRYVLNNALKHALACALPDPCSSGAVFDGWRGFEPRSGTRAPVCEPSCWLLVVGWRRCGLIDLDEVPAPGR